MESFHGGNFNLKQVLQEREKTIQKTKIICTIGPASDKEEILLEMIDSGMNISRLNFSHGDHKQHGEKVEMLRKAFRKRKSKQVSILLDTKGPEIRTGFFENDQNEIFLTKDQKLILTTDYEFKGNNKKFACSYTDLPKSVEVGSKILISDGGLELLVEKINEKDIECVVLNDFKLGQRKNMNLPGCKVNLPTITEKDEDDIVNFGLKKNVDMIALSFVRSAKDIEYCRELLGPKGRNIKIISKIENQEGLDNYEEILLSSDAIMIARGDLGMEIDPSKVFVAQKWMIERANIVGKPVIVATQMLETMINNPRPTRAEASDVANAVLDGADCVMLSGETANGKNVLKAIQTMKKICIEAENCKDYYDLFLKLSNKTLKKDITVQTAICNAAVQVSFQLKTKLILCLTENGFIAKEISRYRPKSYILAVSNDEKVIKGLNLNYGIISIKVPSFEGIENLIKFAIKNCIDKKILNFNDQIVLLQGENEEEIDNNIIMKIINVTPNFIN